ncbi:xylan 1,4-beta-xylosidase [uncultured Bacteroides sp.]|jgi:glycoside hydrolase family beta-glycosidase|uniref:xylan 1,4-beta-xylosidase n=1 Tax=uncultured Bacteroides sp. TaxID=162156 RepID=UPI00280BB9C2|nr:xylan 1,4-beta-xylosidase [uncultured Bacteroides sp.]
MRNRIAYLLACLAVSGGSLAQPIYKDSSYSPAERAEDLVKQLTLEEKVSLMMDNSKPVERLGIKPYNWWNEALHGVARSGWATVFPQPIGMAASFSPEALHTAFVAVSDEARAKNAAYSAEGSYKRYQGLTIWTPTVNIYRDPRWGRGIETYGEDPYLASVMGVSVVKGLQCLDENEKYDKVHACAKHFAVHSGPEWNRHSFNAENISPRDLYETYLPPFEALVKEGKVKEVMCAYNRFEGEPCCGSNRLLHHILRQEWGYEGIVVSDCSAISDFHNGKGHKTHADAASASSAAVLSGTDLECGSNYRSLTEGVKRGLIDEADIDRSVKRLLQARFELGEMDDPAQVKWAQIPYSVVCSDKHDSLSLDMARKSMTLLQNKEHMLPLDRDGITIAVMGPNANDSVMQWGNYNGIPKRTITILDGIRSALGKNSRLIYEQGCSWVERTLIRSVFNQCKSKEGAGFSARYWNNTEFEGAPVATARLTTPFRLCTSGATVFAPGVNLTDFSAIYRSVFTPQETGEVVFDFYSYGSVQLLVDGKEIGSFTNKHGSRPRAYGMHVDAGKSYDIEIKFRYFSSDAQLNFDLGFKEEADIQRSVAKVKDADVVIFAGGISPQLEGEEMGVKLPGFRGGDRTDIELPAVQREMIKALHDAGKKIVFVNCSGSPIAMEPEVEHCQAILQAWYPGQSGGKAVADVLFGDYNPAGRLPATFYRNLAQLPDFEDYDMAGHTYRFFKGEPLFPFGYGLSYTTFKYGKMRLTSSVKVGETAKITVPVTNTGSRNGEEVVQVYLKKQGETDGPIKTLRAFKRVFIPAGKTVEVELELTPKQLEWWDDATNTMRTMPNTFDVMIGGSSKDSDLQKKTLKLL